MVNTKQKTNWEGNTNIITGGDTTNVQYQWCVLGPQAHSQFLDSIPLVVQSFGCCGWMPCQSTTKFPPFKTLLKRSMLAWHVSPRLVSRVPLSEMCPAFKGCGHHVSGCQILFLKLGSWNQVGLLLLHRPPCCLATPLPELLEAVSGLAVEFPKLLVLGDFNVPWVWPQKRLRSS